MFLNDVWDRYEELKPNIKRSSIDQIGYSVTAFEKWSETKRTVDEIDADALAEFARWRIKHVSPKTLSRNLSDVITLIRFAIRQLKIPMTVPYVEPVPVPRPIPTAWTVPEVSAMVEKCQSLDGWMRNLPIRRSVWWVALILFLYDSGSRIHAALSLDVNDFDPQMRTATLRGEHAKTGYEQVVDLSPESVESMQEVIAASGNQTGLAFPWPWTHRKLWVDLHAIIGEAEVRGGRYVGFHRLRKTHATQQVIVHGWEHARVSLGHSTESMTRRYVDLRQIPRTPLSIPRPVIQKSKSSG